MNTTPILIIILFLLVVSLWGILGILTWVPEPVIRPTTRSEPIRVCVWNQIKQECGKIIN